jgi:Plasmid pRiA4b ORF-3-like protein
VVSATHLERGEPAAEAGKLIRRQLGHSFGDFFDLHVAQYSTAGARLRRGRGWVAPRALGGQTRDVTADDDIAVLRIELEDIEPLIWRRVAVRSSMTLKAVHSVIQAVMGWRDCHLWEFTANERKYSMLIRDDPDWNERIKNAATTKLSALQTTGIAEIGYVYDMGDNWQHRIIVEKLKAAEPGVLYPQLLGGERRCPPEDCGGIPGYYEFLDDIAGKQGKKRKAALGWYGAPYDPDEIDGQKIVTALKQISNKGRRTR